MVNEEVSSKTCNLAVRTTKLTLHVIINALKEQARKAEQRKLHKTEEPPHGKQSIKELIGQGQGVTSVDVSKTELKGFQKIAKKYGVDFAVVKDKHLGLAVIWMITLILTKQYWLNYQTDNFQFVGL